MQDEPIADEAKDASPMRLRYDGLLLSLEQLVMGAISKEEREREAEAAMSERDKAEKGDHQS